MSRSIGNVLFNTALHEAKRPPITEAARIPSQLRNDEDMLVFKDPESGEIVVFYPSEHGKVWCCYGDSLEDMDPGDAEEMTAQEADKEAGKLRFVKLTKQG